MSALEVILPLRNPPAALNETVRSLATQTDRRFSVLISDNHSTAGGEFIEAAAGRLQAAGLTVRRVRPPVELGRVEHWNWAHHEASGEWLKPIFAGDWLEPQYVAELNAARAAHPPCRYIFSSFVYHHGDAPPVTVRSAWADRFVPPQPMREIVLRYGMQFGPPSAAAFERTAFIGAGGYPTALPITADSLLFCALASRHGALGLAEPLCHFNIHAARFSTTLPAKRKITLQENLTYLPMLVCRARAEGASIPWLGFARLLTREVRGHLGKNDFMTPALEIIIPVRNPGAALARAINSLATQTDRKFGVILSDNFSVTGLDHLRDAEERLAAAEIPVRRLRPPGELERIEHWNWAHAQSQAGWLKLLLPGERLAPEHVARVSEKVRENPRAGLVRCDAEVATEWGPEIQRAPFDQASLRPAELLEHFPGRMDWLVQSGNMAYTRTAWLAGGGFSPHFPACAALHLNIILTLHHGLENLPERLAFVDSTDAPVLNARGAGRVNVWLELWLILRQARNYCLANKLPWSTKWLLPRALIASGQHGQPAAMYGR